MFKRKFNITVLIAIVFSFSSIYAQSQYNLMPMPKSIEYLDGEFVLEESFELRFDKFNSANLKEYSTRFLKHLSNKTGLFFSNIYLDENSNNTPSFVVSVEREGKLQLGENESYYLEIKSNEIILKAESEFGAYNGLETLLQLLEVKNGNYIFPNVKIEDKPRFPWRGLMIDVARHFMPVDVIKRNIDGMSAVKMNVLHLHLADDQGFRIESKTYPKLHEISSDGLYFSQAQMKDIINYAGKRGIRIVPEFDVPGHATSWIAAYPELSSSDTVYTLERKWGIFDPTLNPIKQSTYTFLENLFSEMTELFPDDYFHIGGDENNGKSWNKNTDIVKFKNDNGFKTNLELQNYFNKRVLNILNKLNKKMIGWDEILVPGLPKNAVIQSWRGKGSLVNASQNGYQVLLSNGYYIDLIKPTDEHYLNDPIAADMKLTLEQEKMILGGEATMWAEYVNLETIDSRIWPRTAAIAERFWSPNSINDVDDMYRRLDKIEYHLEEYGLTHLKNRDMLLRRLTDNKNIKSLKILLTAIEPLKGYKRGSKKEYTSYSPLSRVVDASYPDPKEARIFTQNINSFLNDKSSINVYNNIMDQLEIWNVNHDNLTPIIEQSPILKEIESLSEDLERVTDLGKILMDVILNNKIISDEEKNEYKNILEKCKQDRGQVEIIIIEPIENLLARVL